jgi:hypothetical protein
MGCLFAVLAGFFPRIADIILWLARPTMFMAPFGGNFLWPILGIVFLPFTTLMYVFMWSPGIGLVGWDWLWLGLAVLLDIGHWGHTGWQNRNAIPGYSGSQTPA